MLQYIKAWDDIIIVADVGTSFHSFTFPRLSQSAMLNHVKKCDNVYTLEHCEAYRPVCIVRALRKTSL